MRLLKSSADTLSSLTSRLTRVVLEHKLDMFRTDSESAETPITSAVELRVMVGFAVGHSHAAGAGSVEVGNMMKLNRRLAEPVMRLLTSNSTKQLSVRFLGEKGTPPMTPFSRRAHVV